MSSTARVSGGLGKTGSLSIIDTKLAPMRMDYKQISAIVTETPVWTGFGFLFEGIISSFFKGFEEEFLTKHIEPQVRKGVEIFLNRVSLWAPLEVGGLLGALQRATAQTAATNAVASARESARNATTNIRAWRPGGVAQRVRNATVDAATEAVVASVAQSLFSRRNGN